MLATLALAAVDLLPVGEVMLGGALAMVLSGVLSMDEAYRAVEWKTVFLVAGMLPMGIAMTKTGAADAAHPRPDRPPRRHRPGGPPRRPGRARASCSPR